MKAPRSRGTAARLADQAREAGWSHEDYLIAVLDREVAARNASGAQLRIRAAGFGARKTLEEFVFDHQPGVRRDDITPLAAGHYLTEARNVVLLGPPGTGKTHCETRPVTRTRIKLSQPTWWFLRLSDLTQQAFRLLE